MVQKSIEKSVRYMLIPILLLKSQYTLHTYSGEQNPKVLSYNIFLYNLSFFIIFNLNFIDLRKVLFKLIELFTGVSMRTHLDSIHRRFSDYPKNSFLSLELAMGSDMKTQKM